MTAGQSLSAYSSSSSSSLELPLLLLQASSITEALLMSPRSMSSTNTKGPLATPGALGGAPSTCPSHDSPASPFPLSPLSPAVSAESASHDARVGNSMSHDRTMSHAGPGRMSDARLGPELMQSGKIVYNRKFLFTFLHFTVPEGIRHRLCSQAASASVLHGSNSSATALYCS